MSDSVDSPTVRLRRNSRKFVRKSASDIEVDRKYKHKTIFIADDDGDDDWSSSDSEELDLSDVEIEEEVELNNNSSDDVDAKRDHEFVRLAESTDLAEILEIFNQMKERIGLSDLPQTFTDVFPKLRDELSNKIPHRYSELLKLLQQRSLNKEYCGNKVASGTKVLIIGNDKTGLYGGITMCFVRWRSLRPEDGSGDAAAGSQHDRHRGQRLHGQEQRHQTLGLRHGGSQRSRG